jgi:8-oxo-dGTP pyrophosphatase MutT (NUDIX family)
MTTSNKLQLSDITNRLAGHRAEILAPVDRGHAAVAMLLREKPFSPEVLFIVRAEHAHDPWSGNIGFPGGRLNPSGELPQDAAERETLEELALDLHHACFLGRLDDLYGAIMPVLVSCFVYEIVQPAALQPNHEIAKTFWCPLSKLLEPSRHQLRNFFYRGAERTHPVVELLEPHEPLLWGLTYRLIRNFFSLCGRDFGLPETFSRRG